MNVCKVHADRPVHARGLCKPCYMAWFAKRPASDTTPAPAPIPTPDPVDARRVKLATAKERKLLDSQVARLAELEEKERVLAALHATPLAPICETVSLDGTRRQGTAVAMLSDLHYGEVVEPSRSTFFNRYNVTIAEFRLERFFSGVEWLIENNRTWCEIHDLILWLGGDLITGHIHEDLAETALGPIESVLALQPLIERGIRRLQARGLRIKLPCSYGNHGRNTVKKRIETGASHSYEWMMYQQIGRNLHDVEILADATPHQYVEAYGKRLHFTHGDDTRYNGGVGGVTIPLNKATAIWQKMDDADWSHYGHYHQLFDGGHWILNGSGIGYNAFARSIKASPEPAQQWFYVLDSKRGRTARSPIWLEDRDAESLL